VLSLRMISVIYTQQVQKGRCKKTQSSFFTSPILRLDTTLSYDNKSIVYAPISRLRRSFAGIRKMPTSKAIKKETCKQACSLFFYRFDWRFIHCFRVYYSIIVATRPDPTVRPPSRYFNPVLSHIFYGFLSKIQ